LIWYHDAVAAIGQEFDRIAPIGSPKIFTVQEQHRSSVRVFGWLHIHEAHPDILPFNVQVQKGGRVRIFKILETGSEGIIVVVRQRFVLGQSRTCQR
jgi:hypothetical protein